MNELKLRARITAAVDARTFDVVILAAGKSANSMDNGSGSSVPIFYSEELLSSPETAALFEGVTVNAHGFGQSFDHIPEAVDKSLFTLQTIGILEGVRYAGKRLALVGRLVLHEGADFIAGLLKLSIERDEPLVGLSIDATGEIKFTAREGIGDVAEVAAFGPSPTVDVVSRPAAGGEILRIAASISGSQVASKEVQMPEPKKPQVGDPKPAAVTEADVNALVEARLAEAKKKDEEERKKRDDAKAAVAEKIRESQALLTTKLKESNLDDDAQAIVRDRFDNQTCTEEEIDGCIAGVRKLTVKLDESGNVNVQVVQVGTETRDRAEAALYHMFMSNSVEPTRIAAEKALKESGAEPIHSLHRFCRQVFGFDLSDGAFGDTKVRRKLTESLTTSSWTDIFGDTMNRALLDAYHANPWTDWRKVVRVQPLNDFRTQHSIRMGGYSNLATVAEGANYEAMTSPGDEEHEWTPAKKGGTEDLTREMILADDVMAISRIPVNLAYAGARTLYEFVFDLLSIAGQPTMDYDATALFATSRATNDNLGTTALAAAEVIVVWKAMQKFVDMSSGKIEAIQPRYLLVPIDLANTAHDIFMPLSVYAPGETTSVEFQRKMNIEPITVVHWTNAKDHVYVADPALVPGFLLGFVGGRQDPELFLQDNASFGSVFDRDAITYKIRHEYGGSPVDHRAFYAEDVA